MSYYYDCIAEVPQIQKYHRPGMILNFFDTETTGFLEYEDPLSGRKIEGEIVQLSAEKYRVNEDLSMSLLEHRNWYFKPSTPVTPGAEEQNHISNDFLMDKPVWAECHQEIREFFEGCVVIAHNLYKFDIKMMQRMYKRMGDSFQPLGTIDTLLLARTCFPNTSRKLEDMIKTLGLKWKVEELCKDATAYHDSRFDVTAMVVLYEAMRKEYVPAMLNKFYVPRIRYMWPTPSAWSHKNQGQYVETDAGRLFLNTYSKSWTAVPNDDAETIDLEQVNMVRFQAAVHEYTRTNNFRDLAKWGRRKEA